MLFTSYSFIAFISLLFLLYYIIPKKGQWPLLLIASYVFYFLCDPRYLIFITVTSVSTYLFGIAIDKVNTRQDEYLKEHKKELSKEDKKTYKAGMKKKRFRLILMCLILNIGILAVIKYTNFTINNINGIMHAFGSDNTIGFVDIIVPMGISFYTFQSMGYIIDVYRGTYKPERNIFKFALFVSFFPQLVQGPISRFNDLSKTLYAEHKFDIKVFTFGVQRILWGFFKKLVIADRIVVAINVLKDNPEQYGGAYVFVLMMFYAFQLYADFTGGIDITIGVAEAMGITVAENFNRPYFSKNIKEYWNRWHITMGTWFTDYIFYPISVCKPMLKLSKASRKHLGEVIGKRVPVYLSAFVVWFTTGLWHGASWNFIVWGLMNFVVIMISQELKPLYVRFHNRFNVDGKRWYDGFQVIRTVLLMSAIRMFDVYRDVPLTFKMVWNMVTDFRISSLWSSTMLNLGLDIADYIILFAGLIILFTVSMLQRRKAVRERLWDKPAVLNCFVTWLLLISIVLFGAYSIGYDSAQFIYNQF